jgi:arylsulfatase A-like enzyme
MLKNRHRRNIGGAAVCAAAAMMCGSVKAEPAARPNFVFIVTDDQRWDALGAVQREMGERARFPWFETPNLDRLANEGVRFRNAFVTYSLCSPARASFLTGQYNHQNGVINNYAPFPARNTTYAGILREAGYGTAFIGKFHHGKQKGPRPGFEYNATFLDQGIYNDCPFELNGQMVDTKGWVDDVSIDFAIDYLKKEKARPFCMWIGFKTPHEPTKPPPRTQKMFQGKTAKLVPNMLTPAIFRHSGEDAQRRELAKAALSDGGGVRANLEYFRCIKATDDAVGRLMKALDELDLADNTVLLFTSDNGFYLGEHCLGDKRSAYEESLRIPMLIRYPKRFPKGKVIDDMVLNIDIAPTFLDMAGLPVPSSMQGRSLAPLVEGRSDGWRESFLAEYFIDREYPNTPTWVAVRTPSTKLVKYPGHDEWTELFDLQTDPYETNNLAKDPARRSVLGDMEHELASQIQLVNYHVPVDAPSARFNPSDSTWRDPSSPNFLKDP